MSIYSAATIIVDTKKSQQCFPVLQLRKKDRTEI